MLETRGGEDDRVEDGGMGDVKDDTPSISPGKPR